MFSIEDDVCLSCSLDSKMKKKKKENVCSSLHWSFWCVLFRFFPLEYIPSVPLHYTFIIVICFVLLNNHRVTFKGDDVNTSLVRYCNIIFILTTHTLRALLTFEKYEATYYDVSGMRRYSQNIFQRYIFQWHEKHRNDQWRLLLLSDICL